MERLEFTKISWAGCKTFQRKILQLGQPINILVSPYQSLYHCTNKILAGSRSRSNRGLPNPIQNDRRTAPAVQVLHEQDSIACPTYKALARLEQTRCPISSNHSRSVARCFPCSSDSPLSICRDKDFSCAELALESFELPY
jgi:hypothetical protein